MKNTVETVLGVPFLTLQDSRARIKGSRDPLGVQPLWSRLGRRVIHNLTTVTTSLRGFTTLLLGLYFAERAVKDQSEGAARMMDFFLKFEQLAAYSRVVRARDRSVRFDEDEIRGILRVQKNLSEKRIIISSKQEWQILSNQKAYGLWGLYTVAARNSGWITPDSPFLTPLCVGFVETE